MEAPGKNRLLRVGLTGGIGSGKSTVAHLLEMLGGAVYDADSQAKALMTSDPVLRSTITSLFGPAAYTPACIAGEPLLLNRTYIAAQVFGDPEKRRTLNALVHPAVEADFLRWTSALEALSPSTRPAYAVEEAAVLIESGGWEQMDYIVVVTAPTKVRIGRVMRRDNTTRESAQARIDAQMEESERLTYADFSVTADERRLLIPQVVELHHVLLHKVADDPEKFLPLLPENQPKNS